VAALTAASVDKFTGSAQVILERIIATNLIQQAQEATKNIAYIGYGRCGIYW
jgi:hypothetical protein